MPESQKCKKNILWFILLFYIVEKKEKLGKEK